MKISNWKYLKVLAGVVLVASMLFAKGLENTNANRTKVFKDADVAVAGGPTQSLININNVAYWITKSGGGTTSGSPNGTQADYPIGTGGIVYEDGMLLGAMVHDGDEDSVRVNGSTYYKGLKGGRVIYKDGVVFGASDPSDAQVWRVRKDWETSDLKKDAASYFATTQEDVTDEQIAEVRAQYLHDWTNWPAAWGAPYEDVDGDGSYDPTVDVPGYPGADQTVWTIGNDVPYVVDDPDNPTAIVDTINTAESLYGSPAIGMELQVTMWAYNFGASDPLGNVVFKKAKIKYTGVPGKTTFGDANTESYISKAYFTQWSDPDLGTYTDDYVGSDIDLSFGYVYNGNAVDGVFNGIYGEPVPAAGYDFLQGPVSDEGDTLGMTSFTYFGAGSSISDPDLGEYEGSLQFWNLMEGYLPRPEYPSQVPWTDLSTGFYTRFVLSGDPVTGQGWIDGVQLPPGDRRLVMASGPFSMKLDEEKEVVLALIGGVGVDNISSVTVAKFHDTFAQYAYDNDFNLPSAPASPNVQSTELDGEILIDWGYNSASVAATEEVVSQGFVFEGYNVYQLPSSGAPLSSGVKVATYDKINVVQTIFDNGVDKQSGFILQQPKQAGTNSGVKRYFATNYDDLRKRPMSNGIQYYFAVTAYSYLPHNEGSPFKTLESSPTVVTVTPHSANPGIEIGSGVGEVLDTDHAVGTAGGDVEAWVVNPDDVTGDDYEVFFDFAYYYRNLQGVWVEAPNDSTAEPVGKLQAGLDCSGSTMSGSALASSDVGTVDLVFSLDMDCGGAWVDGLKLDFPATVTVNSFEGAAGCSYPEYGQNCENFDGTQTGSSILWGTEGGLTTFGGIEGSYSFSVNIDPHDFPFDVDFTLYDDGYDGDGGINGTGTITFTELGYEFKTIKYWGIENTSKGKVVLDDQYLMNGVTLEHVTDGVYDAGGAELGVDAGAIVDGFQVNVDVSYAAPADYATYTHVGGFGGRASAGDDVFSPARANAWLDYDQSGKPFIIGSYSQYGWAASSMAIDTYGDGSTAVTDLQRDYELRFTGVYGDPIAIASGTYTPVESGGSLAMIWGARGYDIADHPDPANPGTGDPFLIRVPFEVWDMEAEGGPAQAFIVIYDRIQNPATSTDMYAFDTDNRMYTEFSVQPYSEITTVADVDESKLTWNLVWWNCAWTFGDIVHFNYGNPIVQGSDIWTFGTPSNNMNAVVTQDDIDNISVYPNPYYGYHELETNRSNKYVTFNHLPASYTIKVFTLGGTMVRQISESADTDQFARWDLNNQYGYPVASGIYLVHIDTEFGEKVLKLAVVQETQVLKYY